MDKELKMKKSLLVILFAILIVSCDFKQKPPTKITKEYLSGKEFVADIGIMGTKYFVFTNTDKVSYVIRDKRSYGYEGTYSFEYDEKGKQFIKINEKKGKLRVVLFVKSPTELELVKVKPKVYKVAREFLDIRHKIGKIYELKTTKAE